MTIWLACNMEHAAIFICILKKKLHVASNYNLLEPLPYGPNLDLCLFDVLLKSVDSNFPASVFICSVKFCIYH